MKKKVFFSLFVAMLLSFGMMAKSNHTTVKVIHGVVKNHIITPQKIANTNVNCVVVLLSCMKALSCGSSTTAIVEEAMRLEDALCG
jgi:hypothetical protein